MKVDCVYSKFEDNVNSVNMLHYAAPKLNQLNIELDISEIYRSELVLLVSAFDTFIHDVIADLKTESLMDSRMWRKNLKSRYGISPSLTKKIRKEPDRNERKKKFRAASLEKLQHSTFQKSKRIASVFSECGFPDIWASVSDNTSDNADNLTKKLDAIVKERHKIAHESHIDPVTGKKRPMDADYIQEAGTFLVFIAFGIKQVVESRDLLK